MSEQKQYFNLQLGELQRVIKELESDNALLSDDLAQRVRDMTQENEQLKRRAKKSKHEATTRYKEKILNLEREYSKILGELSDQHKIIESLNRENREKEQLIRQFQITIDEQEQNIASIEQEIGLY